MFKLHLLCSFHFLPKKSYGIYNYIYWKKPNHRLIFISFFIHPLMDKLLELFLKLPAIGPISIVQWTRSCRYWHDQEPLTAKNQFREKHYTVEFLTADFFLNVIFNIYCIVNCSMLGEYYPIRGNIAINT